ncbi:MAG TPA: hypothetical protein VGV92_05135 [Gammaproteobacteria bacterium]|nr:hypothetical protein [Gammaproteobacteria bacterium]
MIEMNEPDAPLLAAAREGDLAKCTELLQKEGADVNQKNAKNETALVIVSNIIVNAEKKRETVKNDYFNILSLLIAKKAHIASPAKIPFENHLMSNVLLATAAFGRIDIFEQLLYRLGRLGFFEEKPQNTFTHLYQIMEFKSLEPALLDKLANKFQHYLERLAREKKAQPADSPMRAAQHEQATQPSEEAEKKSESPNAKKKR